MTMTTYTPPAIGRMLKVKSDKVLIWIRSGELKAVNIAEHAAGRPRWRIFDDDLQAFLRSRQNVKPAPPAARRKKNRRFAGVTQYF